MSEDFTRWTPTLPEGFEWFADSNGQRTFLVHEPEGFGGHWLAYLKKGRRVFGIEFLLADTPENVMRKVQEGIAVLRLG
jgi:hypothetical protein